MAGRLMDKDLIAAAARGRSIDEALAHWQLAGGAQAGKDAQHWVSIAFAAAKQQRDENRSENRSG
jgi:hypothetical protein